MSIEKPRSRLLCKYVAGLYAFHEVEEYPRHYKIYPNPNTAVALYRGANVTFSDYKLGFSSGDDIGILISDRYRKPCQVTYQSHVDEVVILFKGAGINLFFPDYYAGFKGDGVFDLFRDPEWRELAASWAALRGSIGKSSSIVAQSTCDSGKEIPKIWVRSAV